MNVAASAPVLIELKGAGPNALSVAMLERLDRALEQALSDSVAPLMITGSGHAFSAGLDLKELATLSDDAMANMLRRMEQVALRLFLYPGPTVALINGHCIAGGCLLAACCDYRFAKDDRGQARPIKYGMTAGRLGVLYPPTVLAILAARLHAAHLEDVLLGAARFGSARALEVGLIDELVVGSLRDAGETFLSSRSAVPAEAYGETKRRLRGKKVGRSEEDERYFVEQVIPSWVAPETRARLAAVASKSAPSK